MKSKKQVKTAHKKAGLKVKKNNLRLIAVAFIGLMAGGAGITAIINQNTSTSALEGIKLGELRTINPEYEEYLAAVANGEGDKYDVIPAKYIGVENEKTSGFGSLKGDPASTALPSSYDIRNYGYDSAIKNQGAAGTCWAHGTVTAVESFLKKNELEAPTALSTKQMDYLYTGSTPIAQYISDEYDVTRELGQGGNFLIASLGFYWGVTPVGEAEFFSILQENDPSLQNFPDWSTYSDYEMMMGLLNDNAFYQKPLTYEQMTSVGSDYMITDYSNVALKSSTLETIKRYIYENGAAYVGTTAPGTDDCYDAATKTIVDLGTSVCGAENGHAMTAIGWDDNHSYTDPATGATKKGAFIIQNSWGTSDVFERRGVETYDKMVELGFIDESKYTDEGKAQLRTLVTDYIANYDATEYIYLAYESKEGEVDFGTIMDVKENGSSIVYSEPTGTGFVGKGVKDDEKTAFFTYTTGETTQKIESVAFSIHSFPLVVETTLNLALEVGGQTISLGSIDFPISDRAFQRTIDLATPVEVTGEFSVTATLNYNGSPLGMENEDVDDLRTMIFLQKDNGGGSTTVDPAPTDPTTPTDPTPSVDTGEVTWTQGQNYTIGAGNDLIARVDYALNLLQSVKLDGVVLAESAYSLQSGSTIITVKHEFLDTLDAGDHEIALAYSNGQTVRLGFTVAAATTGGEEDDEEDVAVPNTGSNLLGSENSTAIISYALPATLVLIIALGISVRSRRH